MPEKKKAPASVPCFLCDQDLEVRQTYKNKPYLVCDGCGIQIFVRGKKGIERFEKFISGKNNGKR